jgi:hypothetical protein
MEITEEMINRAKKALETYSDEYEDILKILKKEGNNVSKETVRRMLIMVEGFMFATHFHKIGELIANAPYPDNIILKHQFMKMLDLCDKQRKMWI